VTLARRASALGLALGLAAPLGPAVVPAGVAAAGGTLPTWIALAGFGALGLAGCASVAPVAQPRLSGRLALQVEAFGDQAGRGLNAGFDLLGTAERGELRLSTLLGPQIAAAHWTPGEATLQSPDGEQRFASLEALALAVLGEALPLQAWPDWLRGRPWPGASVQGDAGAPDAFEQLGWQIDLARQAEGFITASRAARAEAPAVVLRVRLDEAR
jgi:outer membrane lipoprotein LolB